VVAAGYENVGTLEFLVDATGNAYFIEINCRIQVEHPVTEMLTGIDLVATQIRIAAGEPLGFSQADVVLRGHALEFRINAEDASTTSGRAPASSSATSCPAARASGWTATCSRGYEVPPFYDSLLGKLIVWGPTGRPPSPARGRPRRAAHRGPDDQRAIHQALLLNEAFLAGG
jgi:acetyl-CoA carboxylase biotin carboxylase subunit